MADPSTRPFAIAIAVLRNHHNPRSEAECWRAAAVLEALDVEALDVLSRAIETGALVLWTREEVNGATAALDAFIAAAKGATS